VSIGLRGAAGAKVLVAVCSGTERDAWFPSARPPTLHANRCEHARPVGPDLIRHIPPGCTARRSLRVLRGMGDRISKGQDVSFHFYPRLCRLHPQSNRAPE